jgi:hypothetical protein
MVVEIQAEMMILGATAADTAVTIGIEKSRAGVLQSGSPALAPKHPGRGRREH